MDRETAKISRQFLAQAQNEREHEVLAANSNTEFVVARGLSNAAKKILHSKRNGAIGMGAIFGIMATQQVVDNSTYTLVSSLVPTILGGSIIGEKVQAVTNFNKFREKRRGTKPLDLKINNIPSDEIKLAHLRESARDLLKPASANRDFIKPGEVERWVKRGQIQSKYIDDPRVKIAEKLHSRIKEVYPAKPVEITVPTFMRAQRDAIAERSGINYLRRRAAVIYGDHIAGLTASFALWGASAQLLGEKMGLLGPNFDEPIIIATIAVATRIASSETLKQGYDRVAFWRRNEEPEPIRLLEAPKTVPSSVEIPLLPDNEIVIDATQDFVISENPNFPS